MKHHPLLFKEATGLGTLAISVLIAGVNSMMFVAGVPSPDFPITRGGLVLNLFATTLAWIALINGARPRIAQQLLGFALFSFVHFCILSNVWAVVVHGL
jgi:hypothetical protein